MSQKSQNAAKFLVKVESVSEKSLLAKKRFRINSSKASDANSVSSKVSDLPSYKHETSSRGALDLLEHKDNLLRLAEEQNLSYAAKIDQLQAYINDLEDDLDTAKRAFTDEREQATILHRGLNRAVNNIETMTERAVRDQEVIRSLNEQVGAAQVIINDLQHQVDVAEQARQGTWKVVSKYNYLDNNLNRAHAEELRDIVRRKEDELDDAEERQPTVMINKGNYTFEAQVKINILDLPLGDCTYCLNTNRRIVRSCCSLSMCTTCYFRSEGAGRNGVDTQLNCEICTRLADYREQQVIDEEPEEEEEVEEDLYEDYEEQEEEEDNGLAYDQELEPVYVPQDGGIRLVREEVINTFAEYEEETEDLIDDSNVTKRMWLLVTDAIRHGSNTVNSILSAYSELDRFQVVDTINLMMAKRRVVMEDNRIYLI